MITEEQISGAFGDSWYSFQAMTSQFTESDTSLKSEALSMFSKLTLSTQELGLKHGIDDVVFIYLAQKELSIKFSTEDAFQWSEQVTFSETLK
ncbi:hypothetical protein OH460_08730 [Vibrio sp. Makdt]|uniref:hypothetical protein n=1 Tax=Vibrio sp. Makdt TaxID=2998828 RepID=UPI0022CD7A43|nr:hypothetical protein [Vibrio sp. Makdt]MDA0152386.1 hypothetical protein [Vibrio sp. Makdt]